MSISQREKSATSSDQAATPANAKSILTKHEAPLGG